MGLGAAGENQQRPCSRVDQFGNTLRCKGKIGPDRGHELGEDLRPGSGCANLVSVLGDQTVADGDQPISDRSHRFRHRTDQWRTPVGAQEALIHAKIQSALKVLVHPVEAIRPLEEPADLAKVVVPVRTYVAVGRKLSVDVVHVGVIGDLDGANHVTGAAPQAAAALEMLPAGGHGPHVEGRPGERTNWNIRRSDLCVHRAPLRGPSPREAAAACGLTGTVCLANISLVP